MPHLDECPPDSPLVILDDENNVIFRLTGDGVAEMPDPEQAAMIAAIFWREVLNMARELRIPVAFVDVDRKPIVR